MEPEPVVVGAPRPEASRITERIGWLLSCGFLGLTSAITLATGHARCFRSSYHALAASIPDDAYYYLLPAFRFAQKRFFTFDGIHVTSGFQPLWELLLAVIGIFVRDRETFLRTALFATFALRALAAWILFAAALEVRPTKHDPPNFVAGLLAAHLFLLNLPFCETSTVGMENALYACLLALALRWLLASVHRAPASPWRTFVSGLGLGCLPLARLGPASVLLMLAIGWIGTRGSPRRRLWLALGAGAVIAAWLVYSGCALGTLFPVSGKVKLHETWVVVAAGEYWKNIGAIAAGTGRYVLHSLFLAVGWPSRFNGLVAPGLFVTRWLALILTAVLVCATLARTRLWVLLTRGWIALGAAVAGSAMVPPLLWGDQAGLYYFSWYVAELPVIVPLLLATPIQVRRARLALPAIALLGMVFVADALAARPLFAPHARFVETDRAWQNVMLRAALEANRQLALKPQDRVAAWDAGLLGYLSAAPVTELDGLANDDVYRHTRAGGSLIDYLRREKVRYFIDILDRDGWFGPRFSHFEILHRLEFEPGIGNIHGYYIARITDTPFPRLAARTGTGLAEVELPLFSDPPVFGRYRTRNLRFRPGRGGSAWAEFATDGGYGSMRAFAGTGDPPAPASPSRPACARLAVHGDGRPLFADRAMSAPTEVQVDIRGVRTLRLTVDGAECPTPWDSFYVADLTFGP
jgi:hypothetical protein